MESKKAHYFIEIETKLASLIPGHITIERIIYQGLREEWAKEGKVVPSFEEFDINVYRVNR